MLSSNSLATRLRVEKLVAVVVVDEVQAAVPLARALLEGGVSAMELTLRTPAAFDALAAIRRECPEMLVGLGTVLTAEQATRAAAAGAVFAVSPGFNPEVVRAAHTAGLPFAPGVATPSDIEAALAVGCRLLKFFPAEPLGGIHYLQAISAPYAHLGIEFLPLGGLDEHNFLSYLALGNVPAVGGSWLAPRDLIRKGDWAVITQNAKRARARLCEQAVEP